MMNDDTVSDLVPLPAYDEVRRTSLAILDAAWRDGYTSPNLNTYPWMWLWDSCFHAVVWAALDDERALDELRAVFRWQTAEGFVPHMGYQVEPSAAQALWSRHGHSTITQPPMYAHAARRVGESGLPLDDHLLSSVEQGLQFLWRHRMRDDGLLRIVHPWESGADDSPRWDSFVGGPFTKPAFDARKPEMVSALKVLDSGASVASVDFEVGSTMFNALAAFNALEFAALTDDGAWRRRAEDLARALDARWDEREQTWTDAGDHPSAGAPTSDALLGALVVPERLEAVAGQLIDPDSYGARFGPRNVDRRHPGYDGHAYWRGPTWPQINYLLWLALAPMPAAASALAKSTVAGAWESGFAEYWEPETAAGLGAIPQSWTTLALVMHPEAAS